MYTVNKTPKEREKKNKKITTIVIITSILLVIFVILLIVLLLLRNKQDQNNNKVKYQISYDTTLVTDITSLDSKSVSFTVTSGDNKYDVTVKLNTTNSNASIGSYMEHDYLYSIYDGHPNTLDISLQIYSKENPSIKITTISDIKYTLYLGDKDEYHPLSLDINTSTYSSDNLISIYKLDVEFYMNIAS